MYFLFLSCNIMSYEVTKLRSSAIVFAFNIFEKKYKETL